MALYSPELLIRRVTVLQLLKATKLHISAPFCIDGNGFKRVVLLGNPYSVAIRSTFVAFEINDGTGGIRVQLWTERPQRIAQLLQELNPTSQFVRVVGELQTYQNAKIVRANNVFAARDPYEIFEHILKAIQETLIYELGPPPSQYTRAETSDGPEESLEENSREISPLNDASPAEETAPFRSSPNPYLDLNPLQTDIIHCLRDLTRRTRFDSHQVWDGVPINDILDLVRERTPDLVETAFQDTLLSLIDGGFIYRPILNSHCVLNALK
ncbi:hypothetical protein B0H13DRAFT_1938731 [Mycena leptocephala]|nr:hypothetical protein B0H13DRAFT_1938731 [Mycena leptocephala]